MAEKEGEGKERGGGQRDLRTLLFVPRLKTTSLCTFRLRNRPLNQSFAARNTAASTCVVERI